MPEIYDLLINLEKSDYYPFHMPGHKRNMKGQPLGDIAGIDITEIDGFDNLHDADGILLNAEKRANSLYGSEETFFLVNGSTGGVLSAVSAVADTGDTILAARNCHKSLYHAAYLRHLDLKYIYSKVIDGFDFAGGIDPNEMEAIISSSVKAVFVTSPTYEGVVSDISAIAKIAHKHGIPLIVDEAHGSHFGFNENVPDSAVHQNADIVIHSVHKTLPSLTQTALLHVQGNLVNREKLKRYLQIYQSSSPSYIFMASIDSCMKMLERRKSEWFGRLLQYRHDLQVQTEDCKYLFILNTDVIQDPCKIVIATKKSCYNGQQLYHILREKYHLQLEMAESNYVLAIITGNDRESGIARMIKAIREIDTDMEEKKDVENPWTEIFCEKTSIQRITALVEAKPIADAWDCSKEKILLEHAKNRVAAGFVNLYPPGIPLIVPGEEYSEHLIKQMQLYISANMNLQGVDFGKNGENWVFVTSK
ncbi:MAG: aminotransferase class I/II-fold pyridoxal phosphate-dependent enzyme [Butyrivibrio sp.]|nr:aminotransferase class I/II-fold pyridoxal phosphate-dependent enzyme [Butyrivibrio sp.]